MKNPEENAVFTVYFSRQWQDTMLVSLHNLLAVSFQCMAQPRLMAFNEEACRIQKENARLQAEVQQLKSQLARSNFNDNPEENSHPMYLTADNLPPGLDHIDDFYMTPA